MSVFECEICFDFCDVDERGCRENPLDINGNGCVCDDCHIENEIIK